MHNHRPGCCLAALLALVLAAGCGAPAKLSQVSPDNYLKPRSLKLECTQTTPDEALRLAAHSLRDSSDVKTVQNISRWFKDNTTKGGRRFFLGRTAATLYVDRNLSGCIDIATLFAGFTKALDIPTIFIHGVDSKWAHRTRVYSSEEGPLNYRGHTFLELYLDGSWYLLDPTIAVLYSGYDPTLPNLPRDYVVQFKGSDMWGFGITNQDTLYDSMRDFAAQFDQNSYRLPSYHQVNLIAPGALTCYEALVQASKEATGHSSPPGSCGRAGIKLAVSGLLPVGPGFYELTAVRPGDTTPLTEFNVTADSFVDRLGRTLGMFPLPWPMTGISTLRIDYVSGAEGSQNTRHTVLEGMFSRLGTTRLLFGFGAQAADLLSKAQGAFVLTTPDLDDRPAVWFQGADAASESDKCTLDLPVLPDRWQYQAWLSGEEGGMPVLLSLGTFSHAVSSPPGAAEGGNAVAPCIGRSLGSGAPHLVENGLVSGSWEVYITMEPKPDTATDEPFYLKILEGKLAPATRPGTAVKLNPVSGAIPAGQASVVW